MSKGNLGDHDSVATSGRGSRARTGLDSQRDAISLLGRKLQLLHGRHTVVQRLLKGGAIRKSPGHLADPAVLAIALGAGGRSSRSLASGLADSWAPTTNSSRCQRSTISASSVKPAEFELDACQTQRGNGLIDRAVRLGPRIVLADPAAVQQAGRAVVAAPGGDGAVGDRGSAGLPHQAGVARVPALGQQGHFDVVLDDRSRPAPSPAGSSHQRRGRRASSGSS